MTAPLGVILVGLLIFFGGCTLLDEMARRRAKAKVERAHAAAVAAVQRELNRMMSDAYSGAYVEAHDAAAADENAAVMKWAKERERANVISRQWLRKWLSPEQRAEFDNGAFVNKKGKRWPDSFWVTGSKGTRFLIFSNHNFNIIQHCECGLPWRSLCAVPDPLLDLPLYDAMALQKWHLENDEEALIKVANKNSWPPFAFEFRTDFRLPVTLLTSRPASDFFRVSWIRAVPRAVIGDPTS